MHIVRHLTFEELEAALAHAGPSPTDEGVLELIVRRPAVGRREMVGSGELDLQQGLVGDNWVTRGSSRTPDRSAHPDMQLNIMNSRVIGVIAQDRQRWQLAGDQLFVDFDISARNLPPGSRLAIGAAIVEVTPPPHTGCAKFLERFGLDAVKFVNSPDGRTLRLRGLNARVVRPGTVRVGDVVRKMSPS